MSILSQTTDRGVEALPLPSLASDCHVHVFQPGRFPYAADRSYTPGEASLAELRAHHARIGIERAVLVQPSVYGTDNACLLDGLAGLGSDRGRGVAGVDPSVVSDTDLDALWAAGVRGLRVNFEAGGHAASDRPSIIRATAAAAAGRMAIQLYVDVATAAIVAPELVAAGVTLVLDHHAGFNVGVDPDGREFATLLDALASGKLWVKLSAPYRAGDAEPGYPILRAAAERLIAARPDRMVWASDWPHTGGGADRARRDPLSIEPFRAFDARADLGRLGDWVGDRPTFDTILTANAAALFDFPATTEQSNPGREP